MKTLFRAFVVQFFTSETVTSDIQLRQAMAGVLAFVLTPCLILLPRGFGQFQQLAYRATMRVPSAAITRLNTVRGLAFDDLTELAAGLLIAYAMIAVGLVAVYAWDTLTFDRRDAMVLGPLPLKPSTVVTAKLTALGALLLGASLGVGVLNSFLFALETADRAGFGAFVANFFALLTATVGASIVVFSVVVIARAVAVMLGGGQFAGFIGSACQLLLVVALLELVIAAFLTPRQQGRLVVAQMTVPPITWFVAWFEVLRGSARGQWADVIAIGRRASLLVPVAAVSAIGASVLTFRHQMRHALTPSADVGPIGRASVARTIARAFCLNDRYSRAVSDFVLTTVVRNRPQQTPIAMNAGIGVALVAVAFARQRGGASATLLAAPLMIAFWTIVGVRASFFVPGELPAAWTFLVNAPARFASYARGVRGSIVGLVAPIVGVTAWLVGGWSHAMRGVLLVVVLADLVVLTINFLPFSRPYRPGHAKLRIRWPLYAFGAYAFGYGALRVPVALVAVVAAALEPLVGRVAERRWRLVPRADEIADDATTTTLDLTGASGADVDVACDPPDESREPYLPGALADLRHAFRLLRRDRGFSLVVVSTMALAIGANVTLFTIVNGMPGRPGIADDSRAIVVASVDRAGHLFGVSYRDFQDWRARTRTVAELAAYRGVGINLTDRGLAADRATGAYVSAELFQLIGERPILGRDFLLGEDQPGGQPVAILGGGLWKTRYGADPSIVGKTIRANGADVTVIGVMRPGFRFPLIHDLWLPLASAPGLAAERRDVRTLQVVGRLDHGVSVEQARVNFTGLGAALAQAHPDTNRDIRPAVSDYRERLSIANPWTAMLIAVSFVLFVGCANIAALLLARGARRADEMAIRRSLGATRWQLIRQLLVEHALLAVIAGVFGLGAGVVGVRVWIESLPVANWPYWFDFTVNGTVFGYLLGVIVACVLLFGVGPAVVTSRLKPDHQPRLRTNPLLALQLTLTLALLAGAGLLARTLDAVYRADSIVNTADVMFAGVDLPPQRYATAAQRQIAYGQLEDRLAASPDIEAAALASSAPFYDAPSWVVEIDGRSNAADASATTSYVAVGSRYFETLRLKLLRGRPFTSGDGAPGHETVIVNERFVSMYLRGEDPLGRRIRLRNPRDPAGNTPWLTVVGVSPMVRQHYARDFDPVAYVPYRMSPAPTMLVLARSAGAGVSIAAALRTVMTSVDPELPLVNMMSLDQLLAGTRFANEAFATMFGAFALIALLLAAIGLHGVTAYAVRQRTREIGIRVALGAPASTVVWMFVRRILPALAIGVIVGMGAAVGVGQVVKSTLAGTSPHDPATLAAITIVLVAVALASTLAPARRAVRVDPSAALRHE